ncbi:MAG: hypothetical protein Q9163_006202, partial [Psora crenata]
RGDVLDNDEEEAEAEYVEQSQNTEDVGDDEDSDFRGDGSSRNVRIGHDTSFWQGLGSHRKAGKQVASTRVYGRKMNNDDGSQRVEIRLAKNEGLSGEDDGYLKTLFGVLRQNCTGRLSVTLVQGIDFYVQSLRHDFSRFQPSDASKLQKLVAAAANPSGSLKSWSDEAWRDYDFATAGSGTNDQDYASDKIDRISCEGREETDKGTTNPPIEDLAEVIKSAFILQTDVKSRAMFQGCFVGHFGLAFRAASRARRALLFLCRFYAAVLAFTEAVARLSSFRSMSFKFVQPFGAVLPLKDGMKQKAARDVLVGLSARSSEALMAKLCKGERKTTAKVDEEFDKARRQPYHVHAEIQLVDNFESRREETGWRTHPYIGGSKLCCFLCDSFLRHHEFFQYRGSHWKIYHKWHVPEAFKTGKTALVFEIISSTCIS